MMGGAPFLAPIHHQRPSTKAVDIGYSTDIATVQLARIFPSTTVYAGGIRSLTGP